MSALAGLEVTDAEIEVQGGELPGLDGSSKEYVEGLLDVGLASVGTVEREPLFERVFVQEESIKVAVSSGRGVWRYGFLSDAWPFEQEFESIDIVGEFREEIAPARTWAFEHELPAIEQLGLGRGLDATSAVVLGKQGYVNEVRFPDEPARHKLLDLIGDLYLAGFPIRQLNVSACRSGHRAHVEAARSCATRFRARSPSRDRSPSKKSARAGEKEESLPRPIVGVLCLVRFAWLALKGSLCLLLHVYPHEPDIS
ncbi:MAG: UDP-3-O-(3-hydroxymyristoyl) N-acetylglucosamine deacetylase [Armatimonadetes bacterium OLB18]|nr:MAG: UDP-3-O-(3-hydroxymyristoyl) N-acetylglucosamine deacetylase [Armatimonadetes bacterium OLB18]